MTIRERMEQEEYDTLAPHAQRAAESQGRLYPEEDNDVRTCYQRDADRILHSKSFRRLMHKTQVFLSPDGLGFQSGERDRWCWKWWKLV